VAYTVLREHLQPGETGIFLATAHPAKFKESLEPVLKREIPLPPALQEVAERPLLAEAIPAEVGAVRERLGT
jgi:threonine synthase